mmetsp:Transcript_24709/g.61056  ORF Transcript_24709/g.61056 Transcript_24709/m.61056 type:complete len:205 (+) Transcript_24709:788-1402(+)
MKCTASTSSCPPARANQRNRSTRRPSIRGQWRPTTASRHSSRGHSWQRSTEGFRRCRSTSDLSRMSERCVWACRSACATSCSIHTPSSARNRVSTLPSLNSLCCSCQAEPRRLLVWRSARILRSSRSSQCRMRTSRRSLLRQLIRRRPRRRVGLSRRPPMARPNRNRRRDLMYVRMSCLGLAGLVGVSRGVGTQAVATHPTYIV